MKGYVIVEVEVFDKEQYEEYKTLAAESIAFYGGKYLVRGAQTEMLEGEWHPQRIVVLEFPSKERAKEWWNSEMYANPKKIRNQTAKTKMIVVDGYDM